MASAGKRMTFSMWLRHKTPTGKDEKMHQNNIPGLHIGDLTARLPIIQGGMGVGISGAGLAAAVAAEGGIGVISTAGVGFDYPGYRKNPEEISIEALREEIRYARSLTGGILGVNIMVALSNFSDMVQTALEEKIDIILAGAGLPLDMPKYLTKDMHTKLVPIVSSARAARLITQKWYAKYQYYPDAIVVEGPLAGGHLGFKAEQLDDENFALEKLVPEVVEALESFVLADNRRIPVIAAGGIYTGEDIYEIMRLGASGVQMGTRFVATDECDASPAFKESYIGCAKEDIVIINSPVGLPGRAIRNAFIASMEDGRKAPVQCPYHCIKTCDMEKSPYCIALALLNAKKGNMHGGFAFAGQNAYRVEEIIPVRCLMESLQAEYDNACVRSLHCAI